MTISITPAEARAVAKDAYIYGFPMVDGYRIQNAYFIDKADPQYKVPFNHIASFARVFTPADIVVQTPNSDTPYSFAGLDLRAEPVVITVPAIEADRYFSVQLVDLYTFNFDYIGSRATGNGGGGFLIAGPGWNGPTPAGVNKVIRCETELAVAIFRTQLLSPADIDNVKAVQAGYRVEPLSAFLGQTPPKPASTVAFKPPSADGRKIDFFKPLSPDDEKTSLEFFNELSFVLRFCPTDPSETALMARFAQIDVGAGKAIDTASLSPEIAQALHDGMADAWAAFTEFRNTQFATGKVTATQVFGTRQYLNNNYLYRMAAAVLGIYGNTAQEAMYPAYALELGTPPAHGHANVHRALRQGRAAARQRLLVADDVRAARQPAGGQPDRPLPGQLADAAAIRARRRRRPHLLRPEQVPRSGQGSQLAAGPRRAVRGLHAPLLAKARSPRRLLDPTPNDRGRLTSVSSARRPRLFPDLRYFPDLPVLRPRSRVLDAPRKFLTCRVLAWESP